MLNSTVSCAFWISSSISAPFCTTFVTAPKKLVRTLETWVSQSVKEGRISLEEGKEFLSNYRSGLYGYTYLE